MNKQMTDVQVSTNNPNNDGLIYIEQENPTGDYNHYYSSTSRTDRFINSMVARGEGGNQKWQDQLKKV